MCRGTGSDGWSCPEGWMKLKFKPYCVPPVRPAPLSSRAAKVGLAGPVWPSGKATVAPSLHQALFWPPRKPISQNATDQLASMELGWERPPPAWLEAICPEVVQHYREFPSFKVAPGAQSPICTSEYSARSACTMAVLQSIGLAVACGCTCVPACRSALGSRAARPADAMGR